MNHKIKSLLYFAGFVIALITYHTIEQADTIQDNELANNAIENVSSKEALN